MESKKTGKERQSYDEDFKSEIVRMLQSGKRVKELSATFGIAINVLYTWKSKSTMKSKSKGIEEQSNYSLRLLSENEQLRKDNARLQSERDILKKALIVLTASG